MVYRWVFSKLKATALVAVLVPSALAWGQGQLVGANIRFNWIYRPGADLFIVYNENWNAPTFNARETRARQLIIKFAYIYQG